MTHEKITEYIRAAVREVFGTMLGIDVIDHESRVEETSPGPGGGVMSLIGLAGRWAGTGSFECPAELAQKISGRLLMQDCSAIDDEVLDAIGELTNMVMGNVKTMLEEDLGPMGLSIPTVIFGRNFSTRSLSRTKWTVATFGCLDGEIEVRLCLAPSKEDAARSNHAREQISAMLTLLD